MSNFNAVAFAVVSFVIAALALAGVVLAVLTARRGWASQAVDDASPSPDELTAPVARTTSVTTSGADDAI